MINTATFARPKGAKDKKPRKRRKTRIEKRLEKKVGSIKEQFQPEPNTLQKGIKYVRENPGKVLAGAGTLALVGTTKGVKLTRNLEKLVGKDKIQAVRKNILDRFGKLKKKRLPNLKNLKRKKFSNEEELFEFARPKGAKDKKPRKRRGKKASKKIYNSKEKPEISAETKEKLAKAQAFRSRVMPILAGIREARGLSKMLGNFSNFANAYQQDMPLVMDMEGKKIRGRGGIVKILAHAISTETDRIIDYQPQEYDSRNRYYERYATLLADPQGRVTKSKDVGGPPDINKGQVYGQQGIAAKKGKVGGSMLTRQYNQAYESAEFMSDMIEKYKKRFKKFAGKAKSYGKEKVGKAREKIKEAKVGSKVAGAALKGAYTTGRYAEKASQAKKRYLGK